VLPFTIGLLPAATVPPAPEEVMVVPAVERVEVVEVIPVTLSVAAVDAPAEVVA
jgi:hypothetical protein